MDWNGIVKVFGAYHGIECDKVETMEEADAQLCELYAKETPAVTGKLITGAEWAEYQRLKAQKPTAPASMVDGNTSDGYHTFNELYDHRIALYLDIVSQNSEYFWKSKKHEDGSCFEGWFILGGNMGTGDISYHIPMDKWEMAKCREIPFGKKWDGHKPEDVVERVLRHSQAQKPTAPAGLVEELAALEHDQKLVKRLRELERDWSSQLTDPENWRKWLKKIADEFEKEAGI